MVVIRWSFSVEGTASVIGEIVQQTANNATSWKSPVDWAERKWLISDETQVKF
jgi:hypothetical protein